MKMFKKIMAVALVGVMALSMLTGCAVTDSLKEKALRDALGTAASIGLGKGETVKFKGDGDLDKVAKDAVKDLTYDEEITVEVDEKYAPAVAEIKKSTNSVDEFANGYAMELLEKLCSNGFEIEKGTHKLGVKFFNLEDEDKKTHYYVLVVAEASAAAL